MTKLMDHGRVQGRVLIADADANACSSLVIWHDGISTNARIGMKYKKRISLLGVFGELDFDHVFPSLDGALERFLSGLAELTCALV